jgi:hypothetical protein
MRWIFLAVALATAAPAAAQDSGGDTQPAEGETREEMVWVSGLDFARATVEPFMGELQSLMSSIDGRLDKMVMAMEARNGLIEQQTNAIKAQTQALQDQADAMQALSQAIQNSAPTHDNPLPVGIYMGIQPQPVTPETRTEAEPQEGSGG